MTLIDTINVLTEQINFHKYANYSNCYYYSKGGNFRIFRIFGRNLQKLIPIEFLIRNSQNCMRRSVLKYEIRRL